MMMQVIATCANCHKQYVLKRGARGVLSQAKTCSSKCSAEYSFFQKYGRQMIRREKKGRNVKHVTKQQAHESIPPLHASDVPFEICIDLLEAMFNQCMDDFDTFARALRRHHLECVSKFKIKINEFVGMNKKPLVWEYRNAQSAWDWLHRPQDTWRDNLLGSINLDARDLARVAQSKYGYLKPFFTHGIIY